MLQANLLTSRMLRARTPHDGTARQARKSDTEATARTVHGTRRRHALLHLLRDLLMDRISEVLDGALPAAQNDGRVVVRGEPARLGVYTHEVERLPHLLDQLVDVPPLARGDGHAHRDAVEQVELLQ